MFFNENILFVFLSLNSDMFMFQNQLPITNTGFYENRLFLIIGINILKKNTNKIHYVFLIMLLKAHL